MSRHRLTSRRNNLTLGSQLIRELSRRRELGMYFDYAGYRDLRRAERIDDLARFLKQSGFHNTPMTTDVSLIADWLQANARAKSSQSLLVWLAFDPLGGILALPSWLLFRLTKHRS